MTIAETIKMTAEQYLQLGEDPPGVRLELVEGVIRVSPSPTNEHAYTLGRVWKVLTNYVDDHGLGLVMSDTDTVVTAFTVRRPDIYFFARARARQLVGDEPIRIPPDLAIEIISPSSRRTDRQIKFKEYAEFGVAYYWLVDPKKKSVEAFALKKGKYVPAGAGTGNETANLPPFDELEIDLAKLWWPGQ